MRKPKMDDDRAVEIVKWGHHYAKPAPSVKEVLEAVDYLLRRPDLYDKIFQSDR